MYRSACEYSYVQRGCCWWQSYFLDKDWWVFLSVVGKVTCLVSPLEVFFCITVIAAYSRIEISHQQHDVVSWDAIQIWLQSAVELVFVLFINTVGLDNSWLNVVYNRSTCYSCGSKRETDKQTDTLTGRVSISVQISAQDGIVALGKAHTRSAMSLSNLHKAALDCTNTCLYTDRFWPRGVQRQPFSTPLSWWQLKLLMLCPVHAQKVPQASKHLYPAKL